MTIEDRLWKLQREFYGAKCDDWVNDIRKIRLLVRALDRRHSKMQEAMVKAIMQRFGVEPEEFLIVQGWDICTKRGTILCDAGFQNPRWAQIDANPTVGRNETGHKLPATGGFGHD